MEVNFDVFYLGAISFLAFFVKAMTGFGPAIIMISLGSLVFAPQIIIATSTLLDLVAGLYMVKSVGAKSNFKFLSGLISSMVVGTIIGALLLDMIPEETFQPLIAIVILILALWFVLIRSRFTNEHLKSEFPDSCDAADYGFSFLAGFSGGLFGIAGPPIVWHLGRRYEKATFRGLLITVFFVSTLARTSVYLGTGLINWQTGKYALICVPSLILGIYLGQRAFNCISEHRFSAVVGAVLLAISAKLLFIP